MLSACPEPGRARAAGDSRAQRRQRILLTAGALGPVIFNAGYLINGTKQPAYSSWNHTISTLSLGRHGWIQDANFMLYGACTFCFAEGLRCSDAAQGRESALLFTAGMALVVLSEFRSDPILGFSPGEPIIATAQGAVHNAASLIVFSAFPAAVLSTVRRPIDAWQAFSILTGVLSLGSIGAYGVAVARAEGDGRRASAAGFLERLPALLIGCWQTAAAVRVLTGQPATLVGGHLDEEELCDPE